MIEGEWKIWLCGGTARRVSDLILNKAVSRKRHHVVMVCGRVHSPEVPKKQYGLKYPHLAAWIVFNHLTKTRSVEVRSEAEKSSTSKTRLRTFWWRPRAIRSPEGSSAKAVPMQIWGAEDQRVRPTKDLERLSTIARRRSGFGPPGREARVGRCRTG